MQHKHKRYRFLALRPTLLPFLPRIIKDSIQAASGSGGG
jgi:hypothetical protein